MTHLPRDATAWPPLLRPQVMNIEWQLFAFVNVAIGSLGTAIQVVDRMLMESIRVRTLQNVLQARRPGQSEYSIPRFSISLCIIGLRYKVNLTRV